MPEQRPADRGCESDAVTRTRAHPNSARRPRRAPPQIRPGHAALCAGPREQARRRAPVRHRRRVAGASACATTAVEKRGGPMRIADSPSKNPGRRREARGAIEGDLLTGGCVLRRRPQLILANHLCCFTSEAPLLLPRRVVSRLSRSRRMMSLHDLCDPKIGGSRASSETTTEWAEMKHLRRYLGSVPEADGEVHDIMECIVPLCALERRCRVLGNRKKARSCQKTEMDSGGGAGRGPPHKVKNTHNHLVNQNTECPPVHC